MKIESQDDLSNTNRRETVVPRIVDPGIIDLVAATTYAVADALASCRDWGPSGQRTGQYASDLVADAAAHQVLDAAGVGVLSEESGLVRGDASVVVVIDPLDGSSNAARRVGWWATSICAVDEHGLAASMVFDLVHGTTYRAVRGGGAWRDETPIASSGCHAAGDAFVGISGLPPRSLGWRQFRAFGAAALDLCAVADGRLDAYVDCSPDAHGVWDYAGAMLVCQEAGVSIVDAQGRELVVLDHASRRTPVAGATTELCEELVLARREAFGR